MWEQILSFLMAPTLEDKNDDFLPTSLLNGPVYLLGSFKYDPSGEIHK